MRLRCDDGQILRQPHAPLSPEKRKEILAGASRRLEIAGRQAVAICEHCGNSMEFSGKPVCQPCSNLEPAQAGSDAEDEKFRAENRLMLKILAVLLFVGFLIIAGILKFAPHRV